MYLYDAYKYTEHPNSNELNITPYVKIKRITVVGLSLPGRPNLHKMCKNKTYEFPDQSRHF